MTEYRGIFAAKPAPLLFRVGCGWRIQLGPMIFTFAIVWVLP